MGRESLKLFLKGKAVGGLVEFVRRKLDSVTCWTKG